MNTTTTSNIKNRLYDENCKFTNLQTTSKENSEPRTKFTPNSCRNNSAKRFNFNNDLELNKQQLLNSTKLDSHRSHLSTTRIDSGSKINNLTPRHHTLNSIDKQLQSRLSNYTNFNQENQHKSINHNQSSQFLNTSKPTFGSNQSNIEHQKSNFSTKIATSYDNLSNISSQFKFSEKISDKNLEICQLKEENLKMKLKCSEFETKIYNLTSEIQNLKENESNQRNKSRIMQDENKFKEESNMDSILDERQKYKQKQDVLKEKQEIIHKDNKRLLGLINLNENNQVTIQDQSAIKNENKKIQADNNKLSAQNMKNQNEIEDLKSTVKDLNQLVEKMNNQVISQKDFIRIIKKMENVEIDLNNLNTVADKICSNKLFEVDNLFDYKQPKMYTDVSLNTKDIDDKATILSKSCSKLRNRISEYAAMQMGENCKLN